MTVKRVLIVDDALELGRLIKEAVLTLDGQMQVSVVPSAEEAMLEMSRLAVQLVVTDIRLPGISGLDLTRRIRAKFKDTPVIQISAMPDPTLKDQSLKAGAVYFFQKPLAMSDFLNAVAILLAVQPVIPVVKPPPFESSPGDPLEDLLSGLQRSLGATFVTILNENGRPLVPQGEPPERLMAPELVPALLNILTAGKEISQILDQAEPENVFAFKGQKFYLLVAPVGNGFSLLLVLKNDRKTVRLAIAFDELISARKELEGILDKMGLGMAQAGLDKTRTVEKGGAPAAPQAETHHRRGKTAPLPQAASTPPAGKTGPVRVEGKAVPPAFLEETAPLDPKLGADLDALLKGVTKPSNPEDLNAFWEAAVEQVENNPTGGKDDMNYEQAHRLGLAPDSLTSGKRP